jgi:DNA-binding response OmpR family regulator
MTAHGADVDQRGRVLIVEDDDVLRSALTLGLEAEGFAVDAVASATAAFTSIAAVRPDVVLLDWWLGEGEMGAVACRRLTAEIGPRVVMHTGLSDARDREAAYRAGAVGFIQKGMPIEELAGRLHTVVSDAEADSGR